MSHKSYFSSRANTQIIYDSVSSTVKNDNGSNTKAERENTSIPSSGKYCPICNEMVGNGNPDRENIYDSDGAEIGRQHGACVRRLTIARGKNTELRGNVNLQLQTSGVPIGIGTRIPLVL